jgi:hypothetical protein
MPFITVSEDAAFRCAGCGHVIQVRKGQLLPPCTRCGGPMQQLDGPPPERPQKTCG